MDNVSLEQVLERMGVSIDLTFSLVFLGLIWVRILAMGSIVPFLFGKPVPRYVLVATSMVLALFAYPALAPVHPIKLASDHMFLFMLYLKEAFYGLLIGLVAGAFFYAFQAVGVMVDNQRGTSIARLLIPQLGEQGSISGAFLFQFSIAVYLVLGGHLQFLDAFFMSFVKLPILQFPHAANLMDTIDLIIKLTGEVIFIAMQLAAPVIIAIFIADIILGIANRIAPQINVWELGFNIKGYLGILLLFVSITLIAKQFEHYSEVAGQDLATLVDSLKPKMAQPNPVEPAPESGLPVPDAGPPPVENVP